MSHRQALDVLVMNYFKKLNLFPLYFAHINDENIFISAGLPGLSDFPATLGLYRRIFNNISKWLLPPCALLFLLCLVHIYCGTNRNNLMDYQIDRDRLLSVDTIDNLDVRRVPKLHQRYWCAQRCFAM